MKTAGRLSEHVKIDVALKPQSLATTNATGAYHNVIHWGKVLFVAVAAAMAATKTVILQIYEATDGLGTGAQALTGLTCTITANSGCSSVTLDPTTVIATDSVVVNGHTFTCCTHGTQVLANGTFDVEANDTLTMDHFVEALHVVCPELYGVNNAGTVTIVAREKGDTKVTIGTIVGGTIVAATLEAAAYIEINPSQLSSGFSHVAIKATTDATIVVGASLIRGQGDHSPVQQVAAYDVAA